MPKRSITGTRSLLLLLVLAICLLFRTAEASKGDRLPDFRECVKVCERENCDPNHDPTPIPLHRRLLLWTCPSECDYTCRAWTLLCAALYAAHVAYLKLWAWDYTYNMAANVAVGLVHNALWIYYSVVRYRETGREPWALWPAAIVAWIMAAMSLELFDFPPVWDALDAHSLWHLGTIPPALLWYHFMVKDAQYDMGMSGRMKDF